MRGSDPYGTNCIDEISNILDWTHLIIKGAINFMIGWTQMNRVGSNVKQFSNWMKNISPKVSLGFSIAGYALIGISNIIDGIQSGKSALNIVTDTVFDITAIATITYMGAAIGSIIPGVGTAIGTIIGFAAGFIYSAISTTQIVKDLKKAFYQGVNQFIDDVGRIMLPTRSQKPDGRKNAIPSR